MEKKKEKKEKERKNAKKVAKKMGKEAPQERKKRKKRKKKLHSPAFCQLLKIRHHNILDRFEAIRLVNHRK